MGDPDSPGPTMTFTSLMRDGGENLDLDDSSCGATGPPDP